MKRTLVIGASLNPARYSYLAIQRLVANGIPVKAIGLKKGVVEGVDITTEKELFENIDTVTLYLGPKHQKTYYDYLVALQPRRVIFNPGTYNPELHDLLQKNGIETEIACTLVLLSSNQY